MARLVFPDEASRLVYRVAGSTFYAASGVAAVVYANADASILADIRVHDGTTTAGAAVAGSSLTTDAHSRLPLFWGPDDGADTVYVVVSDGPITPVYARVDDRLDAMLAAAPGPFTLAEQTVLPTPPVNGETLFAVDVEGVSSVRLIAPTGLVTDLQRDDSFIAENRSGATIAKGMAIYQSGVSSGSYALPPTKLPQIALARSDSAATMPCLGLTMEDIPNNGQGRVMTEGMLSGVNTASWSTNTRLYNSKVTAGMLTDIPVAPPEVDQWIGTVLRSHASEGQIFVMTQTAIDAGMPHGYAALDADSKLWDYQVKFPTNSGTVLPAADVTRRGERFIVLGGAGVADTVYTCLKTATDTYVWLQIA